MTVYDLLKKNIGIISLILPRRKGLSLSGQFFEREITRIQDGGTDTRSVVLRKKSVCT